MSMQRLRESPIGDLASIGNGQFAYVPLELPRSLKLTSPTISALDRASRAVGVLAGVGETIPNPNLLIQPFMRREATLSSRIEGTQASLSDLFMYEASGKPHLDVIEVFNYVKALKYGMDNLNCLPICLRLINEIHAILLEGTRGQERRPGELRNQQVHIGVEGTPIEDARFVPPPSELLRDLILDLEKFANEELDMPPLIRCALLHYQFEAIHPYFDGNGRIGRLLIILFLCAAGVMPTPLLYLSAYFERKRDLYYDQLFELSETGNWEKWLQYFLEGIERESKDAVARVRRIRDLQDQYRSVLQVNTESANAFRLLDELFTRPFITAPQASNILGITNPGAWTLLRRLVKLNILVLIEDSWPRLYFARELLECIEDN
ncbi:MAG: Fic family protein [Chloroflexi bacterium]|nr:Fic family protein [Chloroflexota bacterium]MDA1227724.1 Fic family protein [Chloroflexota bacterium]